MGILIVILSLASSIVSVLYRVVITLETISTASIKVTPALISVLTVLVIIEEADLIVKVFKNGRLNAIFPKKCFPAFVPAKVLIPKTITIIIGTIINQ